MWRSTAQWLRFELEPGAGVLVMAGSISTRPAASTSSSPIRSSRDGQGALYLAFTQLRDRLQAEGLFDPDRKRPLPFLPRRVAVVTSASGAAVHDICTVMRRRCAATASSLIPATGAGRRRRRRASARPWSWPMRAPDVEVIIIGPRRRLRGRSLVLQRRARRARHRRLGSDRSFPPSGTRPISRWPTSRPIPGAHSLGGRGAGGAGSG